MADHYIIAAGGTGALCASSFLYMAAAGCADSKSTYHILLLDKDKQSDAMTACHNLLEDYNAMNIQLGKKPGTLVFPKIVLHDWNFTDEIVDEYCRQTQKPAANLASLTLNKLLNPNQDPATAQLLDIMYAPQELDTDLEKGFYGHPNIGAAVFDYVQERFLAQQVTMANGSVKTNSFMSSLHTSLSQGKTFVYLFGSLFGGTGATVIPNVARALRTLQSSSTPPVAYGQNNLVLGGAVIMPYFRLPACPVDSVEALEKVSPSDTKFADQTRQALRYYHESGLLSNLMNLILLGTNHLDETSEVYSRGGVQSQHFHMVHLLAATSANRFFASNLGSMAAALNEPTVYPLGELLMWKVAPNDSGNKGIYRTLTPSELDLTNEYAQLGRFLRFSVVVGYYMRKKFTKDPLQLIHDPEIQCTYKQMTLEGRPMTVKDLKNKTTIELFFQQPVNQTGAICRGFIQYLFDICLSGYDWSNYREKTKTLAAQVNGRQYYTYELGAPNPDAAGKFDMRWAEFGNLTELKSLIESISLGFIVDTKVLNDICSYGMLDESRPPYSVAKFPNSIAQVYEENTLNKLGLRKRIFGGYENDRRYFCEIYHELYNQCQ